MTGHGCIVFDEDLTSYDFGPQHPMHPIRVDLTIRLARYLGVLDSPNVSVVPAPIATDAELQLVHSAAYIAAVRRLSDSPQDHDLRHGLGTEDNPTFAGMHQACAHIVGGTLEAARQVWTGEALHAVNISGGLHHAMAESASGFCIYNDPAIALAWLLSLGAEKILYVDADVHHGDGVQAAFYDDPRVLTVSLHETPRTLFPGTGETAESGGPNARGMSVNVALPPGTADSGWLRAFEAVVPPLAHAFRPDLLVTQLGCDSHMDDPLAHLMMSVDGQRQIHLSLHDLAHEVCGGRWVATGGGGYSVIDVVPRTWTHLLATVSGSPLEPETATPQQWRDDVEAITGHSAPISMTDGRDPEFSPWSRGYNPDSWLDRSVSDTRREVFPWHGIAISY
jgi:acetoin utilization protein AcuC